MPLSSWHSKDVAKMKDAAYRFCGGVWRRPNSGALLVVAGGNGNGKTATLKAITRWCRSVASRKPREDGDGTECITTRYWHWPRLLDELKGGGWEAVDGCIGATVLVLDELGGGYDRSGIGTDKLCQILSHRERKWTAVSTNMLPGAWEEAFDRRVASRLHRNSVIIDLSGAPDWSTVKKS